MKLGLGLCRRVIGLRPSYYNALEPCSGTIAGSRRAIEIHEAE
ncbi:MAG TPA: hypothetical protein VGL23_12705 [Chloroflexota bacterium]|jgi:hypothetical protein